jgi:hypothetical protein
MQIAGEIHRPRARLILLAGVLVLLVSAVIALRSRAWRDSQAQSLLPAMDLYTAAQVHDGFQRLQITPLSDASLSFQVLLPRDWVSYPFTLSQAERARLFPVPLARISPLRRGDALVEVAYVSSPAAQPLDEVLERYRAQLSGRILLRRPGRYNGRLVEDALLRVHHQRLGDVLQRVTLSRSGDRVFLLLGSARPDAYEDLRLTLGAAAVTFTLLSGGR